MNFEQKKIIEEYKNFYKTIGKISSSYFGGEFIYFNRKGFNHLLRKGKSKRAFSDLVARLKFLKYCHPILTASHKFAEVDYRILRNGNEISRFWGFDGHFTNLRVTIVVRQIGEGQKQFFSIYKH